MTALPRPRQHGGQGQNRTADTRIFSPLLYRLSYLAISGRLGFIKRRLVVLDGG